MITFGYRFSHCIGWLVGRSDSHDEDSDRPGCSVDSLSLRYPRYDPGHHHSSVHRHHHYVGMWEEGQCDPYHDTLLTSV